MLQFVICLPLFETEIPANAGIFYSIIMELAAFDLIDIGPMVTEILKLEHTDPVNEKFESLGYESLYFFNNVGSFTLFIAADIALVLCWILLWVSKPVCPKCIGKLREKLRAKLFWNGITSTIMESIMNIIICAFV